MKICMYVTMYVRIYVRMYECKYVRMKNLRQESTCLRHIRCVCVHTRLYNQYECSTCIFVGA